MNYLRANSFNIYIVTGGGQEFVRAYSQRVHGVQPEEVIGSSIQTKYEYHDRKPVLMREPKVFFIDDHTGKVVGINLFLASGHTRHSAISQAISRCWNGLKQAMVRGS